MVPFWLKILMVKPDKEVMMLKKIRNLHFGKIAFLKGIFISLLVFFCICMIYYFIFIRGIHVVFTHFFYIPITLAGFWWGKKQSLFVAVILGVSLMTANIIGLSTRFSENLSRIVMFIVIAWVIGTLRENSLKAEAAVKLAYAELNQIFDTVGDGIRVTDLDFNVVKVNNTFAAISGFEKDHMIGKKCYDVFGNTKCHTDACPLTCILNEKKCIEYDTEKERNDGTLVPCIVTATPLRTPDGKLIGMVGVFKDITERKQIEEELNEQKNFTEKLIQNSSVPTFVINSQHKVIAWNRACEILTGVKASEVKNSENISMIFYGHNRPFLAGLIIQSRFQDISKFYNKYKKSNIIQDGFQGESWFTNLDGQKKYLVFETAPIYNSKGEISAVIETLQDITERKLAEEALHEKNQKMLTELEMAAKVQRELLPKELPETPGVAFAWDFKPSIYVAGDMFNIFKLDNNHIGFYILDVMGHGVQAALKAVTLSYFLKPLSNPNVDTQADTNRLFSPSEVLCLLNERFSSQSKATSFFTIFYGILNIQNYKLTYARAGHCPPIMITNDEKIMELEQGGPAVGLSKDIKYKDYFLELKNGDKLLLYTDGITDAKNNNGKPYSKKRFINFIKQNGNITISELIGSVVNEAAIYLDNKEAEDDLTLLGIEIQGIKIIT